MLKKIYRYYREGQKRRGRARKARRRFELMKEFYGEFVKPGSLCFDIGANHGNRTEVFLSLGAKVVCVEPQAECSGILQEKFGSNNNVTVLNKALDEKEGTAALYSGQSDTLASMSEGWVRAVKDSGRFGDHAWQNKIDVETIRFDSLIDEFGICDFAKIDVEGYEYNVLRGLSRALPVLSFEFTPEVIETSEKCVDHLVHIGMSEFNYSVGEEMNLVLNDWVDGEKLIEALSEYKSNNKVFGDIFARTK